MDEVAKLIRAEVSRETPIEVAKAVAALPPAERGERGDPGPAGRDGIDGKHGTPGLGKDGAPGLNGKDGTDGKDGVGAAGALIDREGNLILTLTDGTQRDLGIVLGKDGRDGLDGKNGADGLSGKDGANGIDGLGFDDMTETLADDGRTIIRRYSRADGQAKEFRHTMSVLLDRGVHKDGQTYQRGDGVTFSGSFWIAQEETSEKPNGGKGWRLAVKRGGEGKPGKDFSAPATPPVKIG
jgi:hypothetical protein